MFDYDSPRAHAARASVFLNKKWVRLGLMIVSAGSFLGWLVLVWVYHLPFGHGLFIFAAWFAMPLFWYEGELSKLLPTPVKGGQIKVHDVLEASVLGRLNKEPSPSDLAKIVGKDTGGRFFGSRFGISQDFITKLASGSPSDTDKIWQYALQMQQRTGEPMLRSAHIFAALIYSLEDYNFYLSQLHLDGDDIEAGLKWQAHIRTVIERYQEKKYHGGIGRDLSFGWAPLLNRYGLNISEQIEAGGLLHREIEGHEEVISQMMHLLSQNGRRNVTLVGEVGVGKTTLVNAFAQRLIENKTSSGELAYRQVIALDSSSLISQARGRGEIEGLLIRLFNEAAKAKNVIIFLDDAQLFLQQGTGSVDLSNILLPVLEGGGIRLILALDEQEWLKISQNNAGLAQLMNRVVVTPLEKDETLKVIEDQILLLESQHDVTYMYQSLTEAYKLAERFIRDQAFPGKAIRLLEAAAGFAEEKYFITEKSVQQAVEKNFAVKVQTASTSEERDTLLNLEGKIHERMINQTHAVKVVSDALRRARAGVRNQSKPIGTFLFLGPTGVGKTELSKSLAATYFSGEENMVRIDLNEYSQATDVSRLLSVPAENPQSLSAQISKQPFSVVLLDEIEKAHPNVLNVLLQMLDEGMLRDNANKEVSFRDSIIIATSNAGAEKIRQHIDAGEELEQFEDAFVNELISSNIFRPEFINRFDEIVLFRPLTIDELTQVVDLIVAGINKTLANQKVSVNLTDKAKEFLASQGYDPRLGARPLRRITQRSIENIVAQKLLVGNVTPGTVFQLDVAELQTALDSRSK